jgi:hypothetical protein
LAGSLSQLGAWDPNAAVCLISCALNIFQGWFLGKDSALLRRFPGVESHSGFAS